MLELPPEDTGLARGVPRESELLIEEDGDTKLEDEIGLAWGDPQSVSITSLCSLSFVPSVASLIDFLSERSSFLASSVS